MSPAYRRFLGAAATLGCLFGSAAPAFSQIFLPPKGEGSVSIVVQQGSIIYHLIPDQEFDRGSIRWNTVYVDFTYGLSKKVALNLALPYSAVEIQWLGPALSGRPGKVSADGRWPGRWVISRHCSRHPRNGAVPP